jgi:hypothetical protein
MKCLFASTSVGSLMLHHPLQTLYPGFEDTYQHCFVNLIENFSNRLQEALVAPANTVKHFSFDMAKGGEIFWANVQTVAWIRQPFSF